LIEEFERKHNFERKGQKNPGHQKTRRQKTRLNEKHVDDSSTTKRVASQSQH
jgi:hypothetical protein